MDSLISAYQHRLGLQNSTFSQIAHDDAMVAIVYKVIQKSGSPLILKVCTRSKDFLREVYFLKHFAGALPVPDICALVPPEADVKGAILMQYLPGELLKMGDLTESLSHEIGALLARIHLNRTSGYGDLTQPGTLCLDPRTYFAQKLEEGLSECDNHLPRAMLEQSRRYLNENLHLLTQADGPCMVHRDFRPGNILVAEGRLQGIIDWAAGRSSFAQEDLCPLEHGEWPMNPEQKESFLAGYASIRPLPDYSAMMPLLRLSRAYATIGFTVKSGTWKSEHARVYRFNRAFLESFCWNLSQ